MQDSTKTSIDVASIGVGISALVDWLPAIAAAFTIIWTAIRIYETATVQAVFARFRKK
jgi:hypothetical protein